MRTGSSDNLNKNLRDITHLTLAIYIQSTAYKSVISSDLVMILGMILRPMIGEDMRDQQERI